MMCFAMNAATQFINPTKGLEYMATGKPIISDARARMWSSSGATSFTSPSGAEEFVSAASRTRCDRRADDRSAFSSGLELAQKCSWEATVATMQGLIKEAIDEEGAALAIETSSP